MLVDLQEQLKGSHALTTIAAAKELLDGDGECDRNALCSKHGITASPAAFERITAVVKQLGLLELPAGAINMDDPADAALLSDLQLLLQTANGVGGHSRSACALKTIAVAVEMLRVDKLNFTASCARHDIKDALGHSKQNIQERVAAVRDRVKELGLLSKTWISPIDRQLVAQVRAFVKGSSVAQAATAVGEHGGDVEAACEHVRAELGLPQQEPEPDVLPTRDLNDDALLRELQRRLKVRSSAPALKTIAVAVDLCRDEKLDFLAACASYGISIASQRKAVYERVVAICDRIRELGLLEAIESGAIVPDDSASSSTTAAASSVSGSSPSTSTSGLPLDDATWLGRLQERVGPVVSRFNGQKKEPPSIKCIAAAVEMCQISQLDLCALCIKHGIPVEAERSNLALFGHLRELRDRIKTLALLEVSPETLALDAPYHPQALLVSLQLRVQRSTTPPNLDNIAAALDLVNGGGSLDLIAACVRRRLELSQSRKESIEALRVRIEQLDEPLDASVTIEAVAEVRAMVKRSGVEKGASVSQAAAAIVRCGDDLVAACDSVRASLGLPPAVEQVEEAEADCAPEDVEGSSDLVPRESRPPPPPLAESLLRELQRRIAVHKKTHVLTGLHLIAAAADLCRDDQPARWDQLDVAAVCARHGISLGNQRKATFDKLKDLRDRMRGFGPLDQLVTPNDVPSTQDDLLFHDLQLLLQTSNGNGGASRPACAIKTIAVAVEMARDSDLDFDAACVKHQVPGVGSSARSGVYDRIAAVRDRIKELGLLSKTWTTPIDRQLVAQVRAFVKGSSVAQAATAVGEHGSDLEAACEYVRRSISEKEEEAAAPSSALLGAGAAGDGDQQQLGWDGVCDDEDVGDVGAWATADAERLVAEMNGDAADESWADPAFFGSELEGEGDGVAAPQPEVEVKVDFQTIPMVAPMGGALNGGLLAGKRNAADAGAASNEAGAPKMPRCL